MNLEQFNENRKHTSNLSPLTESEWQARMKRLASDALYACSACGSQEFVGGFHSPRRCMQCGNPSAWSHTTQKKSFSKNLNRFMSERRLTPHRVADAGKVSVKVMMTWSHAKELPTVKALASLCLKFDVEPAMFFKK